MWTFLACNWAINTWAKWDLIVGILYLNFIFQYCFIFLLFCILGGMIHLKQNVESKKLIFTSNINYPKSNQFLTIGIQRDEKKNQPWTLETLDHFDKDACKPLLLQRDEIGKRKFYMKTLNRYVRIHACKFLFINESCIITSLSIDPWNIFGSLYFVWYQKRYLIDKSKWLIKTTLFLFGNGSGMS
jgi:hypothetical protein